MKQQQEWNKKKKKQQQQLQNSSIYSNLAIDVIRLHAVVNYIYVVFFLLSFFLLLLLKWNAEYRLFFFQL